MDPHAVSRLQIRHLRDRQSFAGTLYADVHLGPDEIKRDVLRLSSSRCEEQGHKRKQVSQMRIAGVESH